MTKHAERISGTFVVAALVLSAVMTARPLAAQTVTNPRFVEFSPSPDHSAVLPSGGQAVTRYDLGFYHQGAAQPFQTNSLGKPTPGSTGVIRLDLSATLTSWPLLGGMLYEARVSAVGPGGSGESAPSNTFSFSTACSYPLSTTGVSLASGGGSGTVLVNTSSGCGWTSISNASWITLTAGSSATGAGSAQFSVTANPGTTARTGTVTIAGQTVTVTQTGAACTYTLSTTAVSLASTASTGSLTVTAGTGCSWTAVDNAAWLTVTAGSTGTANGAVTVTATANPSSAPRMGVLTIAGQTVTVTQAGAPCTYTLSTTALSLASTASTASLTVTAATGCSWSAVGNAAWLTVTAGSTGTANVTVSAAANSSSSPRGAVLTIAGQTVAVTQAGVACTYTLATTALSFESTAVTASIGVTAGTGCSWTAVSSAPWLRVTSGSTGTATGAVALAATVNPESSPRSATVTIAGQTVAVTQAEPPLSVTSLDANVAFPSALGNPITWAATADGGTGPVTYQFWVYDGATWAVGRAWDVSARWTWKPARAGTYTVQVWARNAGSTAPHDAWRQASASITPPPPVTVSSVTPDPASAAAGQAVTWTVQASGGEEPYTYQFWLYDGAQWRIGQDWSTSSRWVWTPPTAGTYTFQVWVRNANSSASFDAYRSFGPFTATHPPVLTATALTPDRTAPAPAGTPVTWTAIARGGTGPYTYQFLISDGTSSVVGRDWSTSSTWTWIPMVLGTYEIEVRVRNAGSSAPYDALRIADPYTVEMPTALIVDGLVPDRAFPVPRRTPVTWTTSAVGGTGPYTYKFYVFNGTAWSVGRDWSSTPTWTWIPASAGTYSFQVWVRNAGSSASYDAYRSAGPATIRGATRITLAPLAMTPGRPLVTGGPALVTATAKGGKGPYSYQFRVFDGSTWSVGRRWSTSNTFSWTPPAPGRYRLRVWVRNAGSVGSWEAWRDLPPVTVIP